MFNIIAAIESTDGKANGSVVNLWKYLSIPKLQRLHRWSLGMDKEFHPTFYHGCSYLSMLGLNLIHVREIGRIIIISQYFITEKVTMTFKYTTLS